MKISTFDEIIKTLDTLNEWLCSLGISSKRDRWHEAALTVQRAKEQRERVECGESPSPASNYVAGLFEAMEIHEIMRAFKGDTSEALKRKLARALCGPVSPLEETPKNSEARNTMFELALAADWKNAGATVELGEPDIFVRDRNACFRVECKRPYRGHSVRANIRDAASQLGRELDREENKTDFGIIAVSLSRVFTQGNLVCFAPEGEGRRVIGAALEDMLEQNRTEWRIREFLDFQERITAVMFHLAVPWDVRGERFIHLSTANFVQAGQRPEGFRVMGEVMSRLYVEPNLNAPLS